jgi:7-cyano-7-deazaguanine synthase in queuosine biosynthesis
LFIGINQNPPDLDSLPGAPQRAKYSTNPRIIFPFVDLYKHNILEFMYDNNQEDLINITHSCTEQKYGRCNRCWQCTERSWAFKQLDKEDTGLL